jgi:hypothetical protein
MPVQRLNHLLSNILSGFVVFGAFGIGASGARNTALDKGKGWSAVKESAAGQYTLTFYGPLADIVSVHAVLQGSVQDVIAQVLSIDVAAREVVLQLHTDGVAANAASGSVVHFSVAFAKNSTG